MSQGMARKLPDPLGFLRQIQALAQQVAHELEPHEAVRGVTVATRALHQLRNAAGLAGPGAGAEKLAVGAVDVLLPHVSKKSGVRSLSGSLVSLLAVGLSGIGYEMPPELLQEVLEHVVRDDGQLLLNAPEVALVKLLHGLAGQPQLAAVSAVTGVRAADQPVPPALAGLAAHLLSIVTALLNSHADAITPAGLAHTLASVSRLGLTETDAYQLSLACRNLAALNAPVPELLDLLGSLVARDPAAIQPQVWADVLSPFAAASRPHPEMLAALLHALPAALPDMPALKAALLVRRAAALERGAMTGRPDLFRAVSDHVAGAPNDQRTVGACAIMTTAWLEVGMYDARCISALCTAALNALPTGLSTDASSSSSESGSDDSDSSSCSSGSDVSFPAHRLGESPEAWRRERLLPVMLWATADMGHVQPDFHNKVLRLLQPALPDLPVSASFHVARGAAVLAGLCSAAACSPAPDTAPHSEALVELRALCCDALDSAVRLCQAQARGPAQGRPWLADECGHAEDERLTPDQVLQLQPAAMMMSLLGRGGDVDSLPASTSDDPAGAEDLLAALKAVHAALGYCEDEPGARMTSGAVVAATLGVAAHNVMHFPASSSPIASPDDEPRAAQLAAALTRVCTESAVQAEGAVGPNVVAGRAGSCWLALAEAPVKVNGGSGSGLAVLLCDNSVTNGPENLPKHAQGVLSPGSTELSYLLLHKRHLMVAKLSRKEWDRVADWPEAAVALLCARAD